MSVFAEGRFFFISPASWAQPGNSDRFLTALLDLLDQLVEFGPTSLAWCSGLDELLWKSPQIPPWRQDVSLNNRLIPVLYRRLPALQQYYELTGDGTVNCLPGHVCDCAERPDGADVMKRLLHAGVSDADPITVAAFAGNTAPAPQTIVIECSCHNSVTIPVLTTRADWIRTYDYSQFCWPGDRTQTARGNLFRAVQLHYELSQGHRLKTTYGIEFSNHFLDDLRTTPDNRIAIIEALGRRIALNPSAETGSGSLEDESLGHNIHRMRVTLGARIHYERTGKGIIFHRYYGESEHDDGI